MCAVQLLSPYQSCRIISRTESRKDTDSSPVHAVLPEQKEAFLRMIKETEIQEMLPAIFAPPSKRSRTGVGTSTPSMSVIPTEDAEACRLWESEVEKRNVCLLPSESNCFQN